MEERKNRAQSGLHFLQVPAMAGGLGRDRGGLRVSGSERARGEPFKGRTAWK